ncbi:unnamed protein product [Somion occarium]|uniref:ACB domain-containing protein n=1 Tax=Somion occarium TaxID=3059160 RepID=A0ABP1D3H9_9APHY
MDPRQLVDTQFDRAVQIVQSLPKTGPIQTGYEEKLTMYSLYKQATVGNVQPPRPNVWDMLGRAKWDAWAKHKDLDSYEAKWMYVDALLKVLRKYSDKTVAMDLVRELESYQPDNPDPNIGRSRARSGSESSSGSSVSELGLSGSRISSTMPTHLRPSQQQVSAQLIPRTPSAAHEPEASTSEEEERDDEVGVEPAPLPVGYAQSQLNRPQSSLSSHRYRTPMASMLMTPPAHNMHVPSAQPMPSFETPSAFEGRLDSPSIPSSAYPTPTVSYPGNLSHSSRTDLMSPPNPYPAHPGYRPPFVGRPYSLQSGAVPRPASRPVLERAIESVQVHLAALTERIEILEGLAHRSTASLSSHASARSPGRAGDRGSPAGGTDNDNPWDFDDMGMWAFVLKPLSRILAMFEQLRGFLARNENRSPTLVVIRRLFLDISFLLCVLAIAKLAWRRSGMRRKEVYAALGGLWRAILGHRRPRVLVDKAV